VNLGIDTDPGRQQPGGLIPVSDGNAYTSYRVIALTKRGDNNSVSYSEMELYGIPEPGTLGLLAIGGLGVLSRRRRRA